MNSRLVAHFTSILRVHLARACLSIGVVCSSVVEQGLCVGSNPTKRNKKTLVLGLT